MPSIDDVWGIFLIESKIFGSDALSRRLNNIEQFQEELFKSMALFTAQINKPIRQNEAEFELLVLISVGDNTAAMIKDVRGNKEYYCLGGEKIGNFMVKSILKDRVVLESPNQTLELSR